MDKLLHSTKKVTFAPDTVDVSMEQPKPTEKQ
jgi:hypothetical protein